MIKTALAGCLLGLVCWMSPAGAQPPPAQPAGDAETALRQTMQEALWPADIVRAARDYLQQYPQGNWADAARALLERAGPGVQALSRKDVRLFRSAFQQVPSSPEFEADLRKAALGDVAVAFRLARHYQRGGDTDAATAGSRYIGWLQYAAVLGHQNAAYELALHFRQQDQPALASQYEARAVALGYTPPTVLDHLRK